MNPVGVDIRNVALSFGTTQVLKDITVSVQPGEFFALLGPSGSGKSTLLRLIAGFNQHQRGEVLIGGRDVTGTQPWKRNVGMVFQNYALWPHMTVEQNVAFGLEERRLPRAQIREKVKAALDLVGLAEFGARRPGQLSGGQQQRVAIARALINDPDMILADEATGNLDSKTAEEILELFDELHGEGKTILLVTHEEEVGLRAESTLRLRDGQIESVRERPVQAV